MPHRHTKQKNKKPLPNNPPRQVEILGMGPCEKIMRNEMPQLQKQVEEDIKQRIGTAGGDPQQVREILVKHLQEIAEKDSDPRVRELANLSLASEARLKDNPSKEAVLEEAKLITGSLGKMNLFRVQGDATTQNSSPAPALAPPKIS